MDMITKFNHVAIVVPDLDEAAQKYKNVLGAQVSKTFDYLEHGVSVVFVKLENTKIELMHPYGEKSPINSTIVFAPTLGINWTHDRMGSLNLNFRFMVNAPLQSDKLNNKSNAMGISIGYRKILDYSIPWLYW